MYLVRAKQRRSATAPREATATVEFAVIAPVMLLLVFGMIEFSRMMMVEQTITNAAREGSRAGVLAGSREADVADSVNTYLANSGVKGATVKVSPDPATVTGGKPVNVTVSVPFKSVSWLPTPLFLGNATLSASVVMRKEAE